MAVVALDKKCTTRMNHTVAWTGLGWAGLKLAWAWLAGLKRASACGVVVLDTDFWEWSGLVDRLFSFAQTGECRLWWLSRGLEGFSDGETTARVWRMWLFGVCGSLVLTFKVLALSLFLCRKKKRTRWVRDEKRPGDE